MTIRIHPLILLAVGLLLPAPSPAQEDPMPQQGVLLVAGAQIRDPRFQESVILLLNAGPGGAMGLIINKPTATRLSTRFRGIGRMGRGRDPLYFGGPVGGHQVLMLLRARKVEGDWARVIDEVFITNSRASMMEALMAARSAEQVRVYAGYAGWAAGQLENEISRGDWHLLPADADVVFRRDMTRLWQELYRKGSEIMVERKGEQVFALQEGKTSDIIALSIRHPRAPLSGIQ